MEEQQTKKKLDNKIIIVLGLALVLIWGGFYLSYPNFFELQKKATQIAQEEARDKEEINKILAFGNLELEAKAFAIYDLETGKLVKGRNEEQVLPLASITKVMTVLVASENQNKEAIITVNQATSASSGGLYQGEKWSLINLAALTLVSSSNEGARALAEQSWSGENQSDFVGKMNQKSQELGLGDMAFTNPTGLDEGGIPGGQGSALSVAKLFSYILKNKPELLTMTKESMIQESSLDNLSHNVLNTNKIVNEIPGLLASKTGLTDLAGGNLAIVANLGLQRPVAIVVLGSSEEGRFSDVKKLVEATLHYYSNLSLN